MAITLAGNTAVGELKFNSSDQVYDYKIIHIPSSNLQITGKWVLYIKGKTSSNYESIYVTGDYNPTANCQLALLSSAYRLLEINLESMKQIMQEFAKLMNKNIILIDVNHIYSIRFVEIFGSQIILNSPYNSTNGSNMNIMLINVQNLLK